MANNITIDLFRKYYEDDSTHDMLVSDYWAHYHSKADVKIESGQITLLSSYGYGDKETKDMLSLVASWSTNLVYLFKQKNKLDIIRVMKTGIALAHKIGWSFSNNCFIHVCEIALLLKPIPQDREFNVINIGDGYGFLSILIKTFSQRAKYLWLILGKRYCFRVSIAQKHFQRVLIF